MTGYLLDTQIVVWGAREPERLSPRAVAILKSESVVFVSAASLWEIETKRQIGKLTLEIDLERHLLDHGFCELAITGRHAREVGRLPQIHRDPFDRILAAQALSENLILVTADRDLARYPIRTVF
jgi:PIN domain nuclease of toxin-antitoxin system